MNEPRRIPPSPELMAKRAAWSNGHDPNQCGDTIGRLWAWGYLNGTRHAADALRDAGRAYAGSYWIHYQRNAAARIGGYREMVAGGSIQTIIEDAEWDVVASERFRALDSELGPPMSPARTAVLGLCVAHHGDGDPAWLLDHIAGWPRQTERLRASIDHATLMTNSGDPERRRQARIMQKTQRLSLQSVLREMQQLSHGRAEASALRDGLVALADHYIREKAKRKSVAQTHPNV